MPNYRYSCTECSDEFLVMHSMNDTPDVKCKKCGAKAVKAIAKVGISFKGSGYYVNDSKGSSSKCASCPNS